MVLKSLTKSPGPNDSMGHLADYMNGVSSLFTCVDNLYYWFYELFLTREGRYRERCIRGALVKNWLQVVVVWLSGSCSAGPAERDWASSCQSPGPRVISEHPHSQKAHWHWWNLIMGLQLSMCLSALFKRQKVKHVIKMLSSKFSFRR